MFQRVCNHAAVLIVGGAIGAVLMAAWHGVAPIVPVQATATHGDQNFAVATGFVDNGIEAFYFLDFLTGDLRAAVVNRRNGEFNAFFEHNVQADFGAISQNAKYLMVTGQADLPRGRGATQIGSSLIYIAEASSGQVFAYALPFNSSTNAAGKAQRGGFLRLAGGSFRTTFVRDE